jgi:hypothetical protein
VRMAITAGSSSAAADKALVSTIMTWSRFSIAAPL